MNNTELMNILKKVNQNNQQQKILYTMGGVIFVAGVTVFILSQKNKKMQANHRIMTELNNDLSVITQQQRDVIIQKDKVIEKLTSENYSFQKIIVEKQNQNAT